MIAYLKRIWLTGFDTAHYFTNLSLKSWFFLIISSFFLGWNGVQVLFSTNFIFRSIEHLRLGDIIFRNFYLQAQTFPLYIFAILTLVLIHWFIHIYMELHFSAKLQKKNLSSEELKAISLNFFVPNLVTVIIILLTMTALFAIILFGNLVLSGFTAYDLDNTHLLAFKLINLGVLLSFLITIVQVDLVLPRMLSGNSFASALHKAFETVDDDVFYILVFYLIKFLLIALTLYLFRYLLNLAILPLFYSVLNSINLPLSLLTIGGLTHLLTNIAIITGLLVASLALFIPVFLIFFVLQRYLLYRTINN